MLHQSVRLRLHRARWLPVQASKVCGGDYGRLSTICYTPVKLSSRKQQLLTTNTLFRLRFILPSPLEESIGYRLAV